MTIALLLLSLALPSPPPARLDMAQLHAYAPSSGRVSAAERTKTPDSDGWWTELGDPQLSALVTRGLEENYDVRTAQTRIDEAEALRMQTRAPLLPTLSWDSSVNMGPLDSLGFQFGGSAGASGMPMQDLPSVYYTASSALNAGIEIDLTGRNILSYRATNKDIRAAEADVVSQQRVLSATIARAYYDLVAAKAQQEVVLEQVKVNRDLLELTELRFETGQATAVDVLQQRQQLAATRTLVPQSETQVRLAQNQLAILLGQTPDRGFASAAELPTLPPAPNVDSTALADRRPEIRAAELRRDAAASRRKSAVRQFVPSLRLSGQAGYQAIRIVDWRSQGFWGVGATLSVPLSTGGLTYGRLQQARAVERRAELQVAQQELVAQREVADASAREELQRETLKAYQEAAESAELAFQEARERYAAGLSEFLPVLTALNAAQQAQLNVISAHRDVISARIDLYAALGGSP